MTQRLTFHGQEMIPRRFGSGDDLGDKEFTVVIEKITIEKTRPCPGAEETEEWCLHFKGAKRPFVFRKQALESVATALNEWDAANWIGKKVTIYAVVTNNGKLGVRAKAATNGETPSPLAAAFAEDEDE